MCSKLAGWWYLVLAAASALPGVAAAAAPLQKTKVEQAVVAVLPTWHGKKAQIIDYLDLTEPFATASPWALVVVQDARPPPADLAMMGNGSPIVICFVKALAPSCTEARGHAGANWFDMTNGLDSAAVVFAGPDQSRRLLMLQTVSAHGMNGNASLGTKLFKYDRKADGFRQVFVNVNGGTNNNAATRFVEHGPLQGDVIVDYPTDHAPFTYWIEVYAPGKSEQYARVLRYRGRTGYGDHNPLPVADSEMPAILERLGFWKPGDALPIPRSRPPGCNRLVFRDREEWCR